MTESRNGPKGFIVVLSGEIIEIPQDDDKSWLTLFYALPKELVEKFPAALEIPRCPYEVLRTDKYDRIVKDDMMKLLIWDSYSWAAWQFFQVKGRNGNYRDIPGSRPNYAGHSPIWQLSYAIIPYMRMKLETHGLGFQNLYNIPMGTEVPWLTYQQFGNLVGNLTDMIVVEQQWQPVIDAAWEMRSPEDYDDKFSVPKNDFMRKWHHNRSGRSISLDKMMETEDGSVLAIADPRAEFEKDIMDENQIEAFKKSTLTDKDQEILRLRMLGHTEQEIADKLGYKTASAVHKRIAKIASIYEDFVAGEYQKYLDEPNN